ncbi:hypothetical protein FRB90_007277 [Tulasnella sp. 427]|nr:hypothetical protein FRB90_007277 [Tulasnella sp. 427]
MAFLPVMEWVGDWNVGELVLNDNSDILKWLSEQESIDDVVRWRCPALSKLKIKSTVSIEDLREFARKRYPESEEEDIAEEEIDIDIERPDILDTLDVSGLWEGSDDEEVDYSGYYDAEEELRVLFGCPDVTGCPRRRKTRDDYDYY